MCRSERDYTEDTFPSNSLVQFSSGQLWSPDEVDQYSQGCLAAFCVEDVTLKQPHLHKKQPAVCCGYMTGDVTVLKYLEWSEPADPPCPDRGRPPSLRRPDHFISPLTLPSLLSALHIDLPTHFPPAGIFAPLGGQSSPRQSNDQPHTRTQRPPLD